MDELRPYQIELKNNLYAALEQYRSVLVQSATGSGKTVVFTSVIKDLVNQGKRGILLVHRRELIRQAEQKIFRTGINYGHIMSGVDAYYSRPMQLASVQTLVRRNMPKKIDFVIVDEAHHSVSSSYRTIINEYPDAKIIGFTATPCRRDGSGFEDIFEKLVLGPSMKFLIQNGYLVEPRIYSVPLREDLSKLKTVAGDYRSSDIEAIMDRDVINGDIVETYKKYAMGKKCVVFATTVKHSLHIVERYNAAGIPAVHIDGETPTEIRDIALRKFAMGDYLILSNVEIVTEGFDCLDESTEILTSTGWKGINEIDKSQHVYALNKDTDKIELVPIIACNKRLRRADETMISIKSQHLDIRTTEGHNFYVKKFKHDRSLSGYKQFSALDLYQGKTKAMHLPLSGKHEFEGVPLSDDELRFIAWFMTDGGFVRTQEISICQSEVKPHDRIRELLKRLKFDFRERLRNPSKSAYSSKNKSYEFAIPKGTHSGKYTRNGWNYLAQYLDKNVSQELHKMSREQFRVFWQELLIGDGSNNQTEKGRKKSQWLWCDRKEQADAYTQMAVLRGFAASYATHITKKGKTVYRVSVRDKQFISIDFSDARSSKINRELKPDDEYVWCVENRLGTIITRRHGKVAILGNCPAIECVQLVRPTQSLSLYLQMAGRGLRSSHGKDRCIILDHANNVFTHQAPQHDRTWKLTGIKKNKRVKSDEEIMQAGDIIVKAKDETGRLFNVNEIPREITSIELVEIIYTIDDERRDYLLRELAIAKKKKLRPLFAFINLTKKYGKPTVDEIHLMQKVAGYKSGWIRHQLEEYGYAEKRMPPQPPKPPMPPQQYNNVQQGKKPTTIAHTWNF